MYVEDGRENPICVSAALFRDRFSALGLSVGSKVGKEWERYDEREIFVGEGEKEEREEAIKPLFFRLL